MKPQGFYSIEQKKKAICTKQVVLALGQIAYPFKNFPIDSDEMVMKGTDLRLSHKNLQEQRFP